MYHDRISIIDLGAREGETESWLREVAEKLYQAFSTTGCAFLVNHGVSEHNLMSAYTTLDEFRALPEDVKNSYPSSPSCPQGYVSESSEQLSKHGTKEMKMSFQFQTLEGRLPKEVGHFREGVENAVKQFLHLTEILLRIYATSLDMDVDVFLSYFDTMMKGDNLTTMRMLYYPAIGDHLPANVTRCGEHKDFGPFTFLAQDLEGGLEVMIGDEWSEVRFPPDALLVIAGETSESWTDCKYKAAMHRVVIPAEAEQRARGRHSVAFFVIPNNEATVGPSFVDKCRPGAFNGTEVQEGEITTFEFIQQKLNAINVEQ